MQLGEVDTSRVAQGSTCGSPMQTTTEGTPVPWLEMMLHMLTDRLDREDGEVTIEYGILVVFLAIVLVTAIGYMTGGIETWFEAISDWLNGSGLPS